MNSEDTQNARHRPKFAGISGLAATAGLSAGATTTTERVLEIIKQYRGKNTEIPVLVMTDVADFSKEQILAALHTEAGRKSMPILLIGELPAGIPGEDAIREILNNLPEPPSISSIIPKMPGFLEMQLGDLPSQTRKPEKPDPYWHEKFNKKRRRDPHDNRGKTSRRK